MKITSSSYLGAAFFAMLVVTLVSVNSCRRNQLKYQIEKTAGDSARFAMKSYVDKDGVQHAQVEQLVQNRDNYILNNKRKVDSLTKALNTSSKRLVEIIELGTSTGGSIRSHVDTQWRFIQVPGTNLFDTVRFSSVSFKDKWMDFRGEILGDTLSATYKVADDLTFITHDKKTGFLGLGRPRILLDVQATNPNTSFTHMKDIELVKVRPKFWSVGPYAGYGYDGREFRPSIGISVQRSLFRF